MKKVLPGTILILCIMMVYFLFIKQNDQENVTTVQKKSDVVIGLLIAGSDECYNAAADVFQALAEKEGWSIIRYSSDYKKEMEMLYVQEYIAKKVDAIVMITTDIITGGLCAKEAAHADIPIFFMMTMPEFPEGTKATAINTLDWYQGGYLSGKYITEHFPYARCLLIEGAYDQGMTEMIRMGFKDALEESDSNVRIALNVSGSWMRPNATAVMEELLQKEEDVFDVIFTNNEEMMLGVLDALKKQNAVHKYKLIALNGREDVGIKYIKEGVLSATIEAPTTLEGDVAFQMVRSYLKGEQLPYHLNIPCKLLTPQNVVDAIPWNAKRYLSKLDSGIRYIDYKNLEVVEKERKWSKDENNYENIFFHK